MLNVVKLSTFNFSLKLSSVQSRGPGNLIVRRDQHCHWDDRGDKYKGLFTYYVSIFMGTNLVLAPPEKFYPGSLEMSIGTIWVTQKRFQGPPARGF